MKNDVRQVYLVHRFITSFAFSMIFSVSSIYYINVIGLNPFQLVITGTILEVSYFLFEIPTGIVADLYSRKLSILVGLMLTSLAFFIEGFIPRFIAVVISQVLWGIGATFLSGALSAWVIDEIDSNANTQLIFLTGAQFSQIAAFLGIICSIILGMISLNLPIIFGAVLFLVIALHHIFYMNEVNFKPIQDLERNTVNSMLTTFYDGVKFIKSSRTLIFVALITLFYGLYSEGVDRLWNIHFINNIGFLDFIKINEVVYFGLINSISMLLMIYVTSRVKKKISKYRYNYDLRVLLILNSILIIGIVIFALSSNFFVGVLAIWSIKVIRKVNSPIFDAYINGEIQSNIRATVLSTISQFDALGQMISGPLLGYLALTISIRTSLLVSALFLVPVVILFSNLVHYRRISEMKKEKKYD